MDPNKAKGFVLIGSLKLSWSTQKSLRSISTCDKLSDCECERESYSPYKNVAQLIAELFLSLTAAIVGTKFPSARAELQVEVLQLLRRNNFILP